VAAIPAAVAIVDDDPSVLKALARLLRTRGFHAKTFLSGQELLAVLSDNFPEFLIVDLQMPEMSGLELHQRLTLKGIDVPTIIVTAHDDDQMRQRCKAAGAVAYLLKPLQALCAAIATATARADWGQPR
jgi:FixJ family two-component response regulator